jgi:pimeloyl-ACP methyl ester carboxylesterase
VVPLDVYLENENELVQAVMTGEVVEGLEGTVGAKLLRADGEARVVVNFHGVSIFFLSVLSMSVSCFFLRVFHVKSFVRCCDFLHFLCPSLNKMSSRHSLLSSITTSLSSTSILTPPQNAGHVAQGQRPATYRSISGIPHTHLLTCDYRGFGLSSLINAPHIPTETGLITDSISLLSYLQSTLTHPPARTILLGQSLGTAVTAASALYFADPSSPFLPADIVHPTPKPTSATTYASLVLVAPFTDLPKLLQSYTLAGLLPILKPLRGYPRIALFFATRIVDTWPTLPRLHELLTVSTHTHIHMLHARNDADISFREAEAVFQPLQSLMLGQEGVSATEERRSIHGAERVKRGAFAYKKVEDARGEKCVELEVVRFGGHNEVVGWAQVSLAVRRGFERAEAGRKGKVGLDVE